MTLFAVRVKDAKSFYVPAPQLTRYWLKIKNPAFERKEPVEIKA
jgi:hypothetical protein